jgi:hypothetical protein
MSDISGGNDKKIRQKTIAQAILEVMGEAKRPMTSQEICQSREKSLSFQYR